MGFWKIVIWDVEGMLKIKGKLEVDGLWLSVVSVKIEWNGVWIVGIKSDRYIWWK